MNKFAATAFLASKISPNFEPYSATIGQNQITMKRTNLLITAVVSATLAFGVAAQAKEHEEENVTKNDVPAAVQKAANAEAKGGKIIRWEKEHGNYEVVIEKKGKEWGVVIDANGKVLSKHDESKEKGEKHEKGEKGEKY